MEWLQQAGTSRGTPACTDVRRLDKQRQRYSSSSSSMQQWHVYKPSPAVAIAVKPAPTAGQEQSVSGVCNIVDAVCDVHKQEPILQPGAAATVLDSCAPSVHFSLLSEAMWLVSCYGRLPPVIASLTCRPAMQQQQQQACQQQQQQQPRTARWLLLRRSHAPTAACATLHGCFATSISVATCNLLS